MLAHWPEHPNVALVTTDGFLYPNAELERRGLLQRKGFPESYDRRALLRFVVDIKSGQGRGRGADVLPPRLRRRARREGRDQAARHRDHRGPQRPPAGPGARGRPHRADAQRLLRLLRVRRRRHRTHPRLVRLAVPAAARDGVPRPGVLLREVRRRSPTTRRSPRPSGSGTPSTAPTSPRTSCPPAPAPPWCCARTRTTRSATCASASSDVSPPREAERQAPAERGWAWPSVREGRANGLGATRGPAAQPTDGGETSERELGADHAGQPVGDVLGELLGRPPRPSPAPAARCRTGAAGPGRCRRAPPPPRPPLRPGPASSSARDLSTSGTLTSTCGSRVTTPARRLEAAAGDRPSARARAAR